MRQQRADSQTKDSNKSNKISHTKIQQEQDNNSADSHPKVRWSVNTVSSSMSLLSTPRAFKPEYVVFGVVMIVVGILAYVCAGQTFEFKIVSEQQCRIQDVNGIRSSNEASQYLSLCRQHEPFEVRESNDERGVEWALLHTLLLAEELQQLPLQHRLFPEDECSDRPFHSSLRVRSFL